MGCVETFPNTLAVGESIKILARSHSDCSFQTSEYKMRQTNEQVLVGLHMTSTVVVEEGKEESHVHITIACLWTGLKVSPLDTVQDT